MFAVSKAKWFLPLRPHKAYLIAEKQDSATAP